MPTGWLHSLWRAGLFGLAYALFARVCDELFRFPGSYIATFWPPSGFTLAVLLRSHHGAWPALLTGLFVGATVEVLTLGIALPVALGWGAGVALEPLLGALLLRRLLNVPSELPRVRDVLVLVGLGGLLAPMLSGFLGAAVSASLLQGDYLTAWLNWWTSAALGVVLVGPFFLSTLPPHPESRPFPWTWARLLEGLVLLALVGVGAQWLFREPVPLPFTLPLPAYASMPFILWGALRFGLPGVATVSATLASIAAWHTAHGHGPFPATQVVPHEQVVSVQTFLALTSLGGLILASTLHERQRAERGQALLAEVSALLTGSLDEKESLEKVAHRVVPRFADGCILFVSREAGGLEPLAAAHVDPSRAPLLSRLLDFTPSLLAPGSPEARQLHTGEALLLPRLSPGHLAALARDEAQLQALEALSPCSLLLVPLRGHQQVLGRLALVSCSRARRFDTRDRLLAEDLARRCAIAVEQARLYRQLREAVQARDDFLAIASHELKTPLTPLSLQLDVLKRKLQSGQPLDVAVLDRLRHHLHRLVTLINDLLDVSRVSAGRLSLWMEPTALDALVREVSASFGSASPVHSLELELPEEEVLVRGDRLRLDQVLANLLDNALKYSPLGGPLRVSLRVEGEQAHLRVSDPGIGIPEDQQAHLFERFFRARNSSSRSFGGLGLGLFICRDIVERHGGHIWVESTLGKGSTFHVTLPLLDAAHPSAHAPHEEPPPLHVH